MAKINTVEAKPNTLVTGTVFKGEVTSDSDFRIDGTLIGTIHCKGKIVVGKTGTIEGEINCHDADVSGTVKAQVVVDQLLSLKSTARLHGDITTSTLSIEPGAQFTGSCNMDGGGLKSGSTSQAHVEQQAKEKALK